MSNTPTLEQNPKAQHTDRAKTLQRLIDSLDLALRNEVVSGETFCELFKLSVSVLELQHADLASDLKVSRPSVSRWSSSKNAPLPIIRRPILEFLQQRAVKILKLNQRNNNR